MHLRNHVFDDILEKGSLRNYDSLYNETLHGPLKDSYQRRTNFKDVASQVISNLFLLSLYCQSLIIHKILEADHRGFIVDHIRNAIDFLDDRGL